MWWCIGSIMRPERARGAYEEVGFESQPTYFIYGKLIQEVWSFPAKECVRSVTTYVVRVYSLSPNSFMATNHLMNEENLNCH